MNLYLKNSSTVQKDVQQKAPSKNVYTRGFFFNNFLGANYFFAFAFGGIITASMT
jgi:hypothetical protein